MEKALTMEYVIKAVGRLVDEHKEKATLLTPEGLYAHREYQTGTYSMGYSQALIDIYKELNKI